MRDIVTNKPRAIHRTALKADGSGKAEMPDRTDTKKMLGPAAGTAIKLQADDEVTVGLGLAEGIETALTIVCAGWQPIWAAGTAGAIERFPVLAGVGALTIFADEDPNGVGLKAARKCAARWEAAGRDWTSDRLWTMEEIAEMIDATLPKPGRPKTYKKGEAALA